jgi:hypothetical protein
VEIAPAARANLGGEIRRQSAEHPVPGADILHVEMLD